jgi:hypothetical protein
MTTKIINKTYGSNAHHYYICEINHKSKKYIIVRPESNLEDEVRRIANSIMDSLNITAPIIEIIQFDKIDKIIEYIELNFNQILSRSQIRDNLEISKKYWRK